MTVIFLLIPLSIAIAAAFLGAFIWAVRTGQYEDTCTPSMRVLLDEAGTVSPADLPLETSTRRDGDGHSPARASAGAPVLNSSHPNP
jgi:cbb3-type cytochrome oxidase maturation protein